MFQITYTIYTKKVSWQFGNVLIETKTPQHPAGGIFVVPFAFIALGEKNWLS